MKTPARRRSTGRFNSLIMFGMLLIASVGMALPAVHSISTAEPSAGDNASTRSLSAARFSGYGNWLPSLAPAALAGETIEIFAADCATPKTAFAAGETICAKTNGVDVSSGNFYVNWHHPDNSTTNGGTITTNPQYTLFSIPTSGSYLGTWKANIGRVTPAESSIIGNPPTFTVSAAPAIATFAYASGACTNTPKTNFVVGETVCARTTGVDPQFNRRFAWVDADGITREFTPITSDPATDEYALVLTETSLGTWKANVVSSRGSAVVGTNFTVATVVPSVDLSIAKGLSSGDIKAGDPATFTIAVYSRGPSDAQNVVITDQTPVNASFLSATQTEGSGFSCTGTTTVTCTGAVLKAGERAVFEFVYTAGTAGQTITNTATVDSDTAETNTDDNSSTAGPYTIGSGSGGGGTCSLNCPDDVETPANTTNPNNPSEEGAIVHFVPPTPDPDCGNITYDHCNDCFFPEGTTVVTGTAAATGETCTFTVTVTPAGSHPVISCPSNHTGNADGNCEAHFNVGTATASGGANVTVVGYRSDGEPMYTCDVYGNCTRNSTDAPFNVGVTTITWYAYAHDAPGPYGPGPLDENGFPVNDEDTEEGHRTGSATCTQTITVNDVTPPTIGATSETIAADASCQAAVPDYSSTVSDNCACTASDNSERCEENNDIAYSQTPAAGTMLPPGTYTVHIEANDGTNNATKDIQLTIADQTDPVITCPANITQNTDPGQCSAVVVTGTATATDNCDTSVTITGTRSDNQALTAPYPTGTTTITWTATDDAGNSSECEQTVTVEDNEDPVIVCPAPTTASADASCEAAIPDRRSEATTSDNCGDVTVTQSPEPGTMVGLGTHTITLTATDSSGNTSTCETTFTVVDTTAPTITVTSQTLTMWPPNHKYKTFLMSQLVSGVSDNCSTLTTDNVVIASVSSDEPENAGGDGNTNNDIVIAADCKSIQLRAERAGIGDGRVYTINVVVKDQAGNVGAASVKVRVPKSGPNGTAVDSGPNYIVNGTCPP